jgi:type I restriction enzyme S subunit
MTTAAIKRPRAFAAQWKNIDKWDVLSAWIRFGFHCSFPLIPLKKVCEVRWKLVTDEQLASDEIAMIDRISFDGEIFAGKKQETKMDQYLAVPGDIVVSKIRARQGSIGIVKKEHGNVSATIHYRVLRPDNALINTEFTWLALRSPFCRTQFLAATGGAMKGEISEEALLDIEIPIPPLLIQNAIVKYWYSAQEKASSVGTTVEQLEQDAARVFVKALGLIVPATLARHKAFALQWEELERWGVGVNQPANRLDVHTSCFPVRMLGELITDLENGWSPQCLGRPAADNEWGVLKVGAVSFGHFDQQQNKALPQQLQPVPRYEVKQGDLIISRANIARYVGACALVKETRPQLMICDKLFRVVWKKQSEILPEYLDEVLKIPHLRYQIENALTGTSPTMKNISKPSLLALQIPVPPLSDQKALVVKISAAREQAAAERAKAGKLLQDVKVEAMILGTKTVEFPSSSVGRASGC